MIMILFEKSGGRSKECNVVVKWLCPDEDAHWYWQVLPNLI